MSLTISNIVLHDILTQHLKGKVSEAITFTFTPDIVKAQSTSDYILDTYFQCDYDNSYIGTSFSIKVNSSINLLSQQEGLTEVIRQNENVVILKQDNITIPFRTTYDERIEISYKKLEPLGKTSIKDFKSIVSSFKNLAMLSKTMEVGVPSIVISSGKVYCIYSNTIFIGIVPMSFPDLDVPYSTFNALSKNLSGNIINLYHDSAKSTMLVEVGTKSAATTILKKPNKDLIYSIECKLDTLESCGDFTCDNLTTLDSVFKYFPKESVSVTFYVDNSIGVTLAYMDGIDIQVGTKDLQTVCNIILSTAQFDALYKTFKDNSVVRLYKGRDIICLKQQEHKTLILSGMTF